MGREVSSIKARFVDAETGAPRTDNILKVVGGVVGVIAFFVDRPEGRPDLTP